MNMKKNIIILLVLVLLFSSASFSLTFSDVGSKDWFYVDVMDLVNRGIVNGFEDGTFKPKDSVNVDQFIKMIITSLGHNFKNGEIYWAQPFIDQAIALNLIEEDTFSNYNRPITRGEMAKIIVHALNEEYTNKMYEYSFYMKDFIEFQDLDVLKAFYFGIITGYPDGYFYPDKNASRAEASTMLVRMIREDRRVDTDYLLNQEAQLMELNDYYMNLRSYYLDLYDKGFEYEPYLFDNGDVLYDSAVGEIDVYIWYNGDIFIGEISDGEYGNQGYFNWQVNEYIGQLENGTRQGVGVMLFDDAVYTGDFLNGDMTGSGMVKWNDGFSFNGEYLDGSVNGLGKQYYPNGDYYIGYFNDGKKDFIGSYSYQNGLTYFGTFNIMFT